MPSGEEPYVHPTAVVVGDVFLSPRSSVWPYAVLRGDLGPIRVGEGSNIQDGCILHTDPGGRVEIGSYVTVGHRAIVHGASVGDESIVGMGAILLEGSSVGRGSIVAAGAVVREGESFPDGVLLAGVPARVIRNDSGLRVRARLNAERYVELARRYKEGRGTSPRPS